MQTSYKLRPWAEKALFFTSFLAILASWALWLAFINSSFFDMEKITNTPIVAFYFYGLSATAALFASAFCTYILSHSYRLSAKMALILYESHNWIAKDGTTTAQIFFLYACKIILWPLVLAIFLLKDFPKLLKSFLIFLLFEKKFK